MVKDILRYAAHEFEAGYDWPLDWNESHKGCRFTVDAAEHKRLARACAWGWYGLLEAISDALHPDGPR